MESRAHRCVWGPGRAASIDRSPAGSTAGARLSLRVAGTARQAPSGRFRRAHGGLPRTPADRWSAPESPAGYDVELRGPTCSTLRDPDTARPAADPTPIRWPRHAASVMDRSLVSGCPIRATRSAAMAATQRCPGAHPSAATAGRPSPRGGPCRRRVRARRASGPSMAGASRRPTRAPPDIPSHVAAAAVGCGCPARPATRSSTTRRDTPRPRATSPRRTWSDDSSRAAPSRPR